MPDESPSSAVRLPPAAPDHVSAVVVVGLCAVALAPTLTFRMGTDQGVFAYMGAAILEGRWPYLQTWENDFPGLMWLQALEILVLGKSIVMFRLFDLIFQLGNGYLIFRIGTRVSGTRVGGLLGAVLFCLIYQGYGPWNTAQREGFGLLFVLVGFWLYFTADRRPAWRTAAAIGLGLGLAVAIKPTLLSLAAFYGPLVFRLRSRRAWSTACAGVAGLATPIVIIVVSYWIAGGLTEMYEACVAYQAVYTARLRGLDPLPVYWMHKVGRMGRNALVLPILCAPLLLWGRHRAERGMLFLAYLGSMYGVFVQGTFAGYHYIPGLAVGAMLLGSLFSDASGAVLGRREWTVGRRGIPLQLAAACAVLAAATSLYVRWPTAVNLVTLRFLGPPTVNEFRIASVFDFTEDVDLAAYLRSHTKTQDPIQIWGYESLVYYLADRYAASRFQMTHPLVMRAPGAGLEPMQLRWRAEFLRDISERPPAYVAVVRHDDWWWAPDQRTSEELLDDFPEWKQVIERDYRLEQTIGRFLVYRRHSTNPLATAAGSASNGND